MDTLISHLTPQTGLFFLVALEIFFLKGQITAVGGVVEQIRLFMRDRDEMIKSFDEGSKAMTLKLVEMKNGPYKKTENPAD